MIVHHVAEVVIFHYLWKKGVNDVTFHKIQENSVHFNQMLSIYRIQRIKDFI